MSQKLKKIMVQRIITVESSASVKKAAELMNKHEIGCLIVMEKEKPVGIITERDMLKRVVNKLRNPQETKVAEVMSKPLITVTSDMRAGEAAKLMIERSIKKLPVVENGKLVGLVTLTDLIRCEGVIDFLNGLPLNNASKRIKKKFSLYFDRSKQFRRRCPLIMKGGFSIGCMGEKCMWWTGDGCVITQIFQSATYQTVSPHL